MFDSFKRTRMFDSFRHLIHIFITVYLVTVLVLGGLLAYQGLRALGYSAPTSIVALLGIFAVMGLLSWVEYRFSGRRL